MNPSPDPEAALALAYISDRLTDPRIEAHFTKNGHKQAATRELLELFGVPLPSWARRGLNGPAGRNKEMLARFNADHPGLTRPRGYVPPSRQGSTNPATIPPQKENMTDQPALVPDGISHAPDLASLPYAERMREHRRAIQDILPFQGREGVIAYVAAHPEASKVQHRSLHRAYLTKPPGYPAALAALVALWFDSNAALAATNKADVERLNAKLGTTFPPANHFNCRLSVECRKKLAEVFRRNGAHLDTKRADSMSKVKKAVVAAKAAARPDNIAFGSIGHRTSSTLTIGQRAFQIERNGRRECIRPRINGSKRRLYLDDVLWLAELLYDGAVEGGSPDLLRSKLVERAYLPETGSTKPDGPPSHESLGLSQSDAQASLSDRIRKQAAVWQAVEPPAQPAGTDPLAFI